MLDDRLGRHGPRRGPVVMICRSSDEGRGRMPGAKLQEQGGQALKTDAECARAAGVLRAVNKPGGGMIETNFSWQRDERE